MHFLPTPIKFWEKLKCTRIIKHALRDFRGNQTVTTIITLKEEIEMNYEGFLELVKNRRTIRRFKADPIPDAYVDRIIEAARWAPSGFNSQPWEFVVIKDKKLKDDVTRIIKPPRPAQASGFSELEDMCEPWMRQKRQPWLDPEMEYQNAPVFILLFGDTRTQLGLPMEVRCDPHIKQSIYLSSLAYAFLYMHLAATTLGLASQWVSSVASPHNHCLLKDLLHIPNQMEVYDMIVLGYPAQKSRPKLMRPLEKMVHRDYFSEESFRPDEEVRDFIKKTRAWVFATHQRGVDKNMVG
jgi:nitroreductase